MRTALVALAVLAASAPAAPPAVVKLDSPPKAEWVAVQCDPVLTTLSAAAAAKWVLIDDQPACDLRPSPDGKMATFAATADGQYRVLVIAGEDIHRVKLVRATVPPQPMPPGPDPKPPEPADLLVKVLQAAYDADPRAAKEKDADRLDLIELYKQAGVLATDPTVLTTGQLVGRVRDTAAVLKIVGLADCRKAIGLELAAVFPDDVPLVAESRAKAVVVFGRLKVCLEQVR